MSAIQVMVDEDRSKNGRFILTGSHQPSLQKGIAQSLAGRTNILVFAADYPDNRLLKAEDIYDKYFELLGMMDFTEEEAEKICMSNAMKIIKKSQNILVSHQNR